MLAGNTILSEDRTYSTLRDDAIKGMYGDCSDEDVALARSLLVPQATAPLTVPATTTEQSFGRVPVLGRLDGPPGRRLAVNIGFAPDQPAILVAGLRDATHQKVIARRTREIQQAGLELQIMMPISPDYNASKSCLWKKFTLVLPTGVHCFKK